MIPQGWAAAIQEARKLARLSSAEVATRTGIAASRIDALEREGHDATVGELLAIARTLRLDFDALLRGEMRREPGATLAFRSRDAQWAALSDVDLLTCEQALRKSRSLLEVNERLGRPRSARWALDAAPPVSDIETEARERSRSVRDLLGNPGGRLPDLVGVCDALDVLVMGHQFQSTDIDAVAVMEEGGRGGAAVLVAQNSHVWRNGLRRRVLLAHEICHVLFDAGSEGSEVIADFDAEATHEAASTEAKHARYLPQELPRERRARAFAAEFLMPTLALRDLLGAPRGVSDYGESTRMVDVVRDHFETPLEIALNQLWNRRYLAPISNLATEDPRRDLLDYLRWKQGPPAPNHGHGHGPDLNLLARRVEEGWRSQRCSDSEARRWLGLSLFDSLPWTTQS